MVRLIFFFLLFAALIIFHCFLFSRCSLLFICFCFCSFHCPPNVLLSVCGMPGCFSKFVLLFTCILFFCVVEFSFFMLFHYSLFPLTISVIPLDLCCFLSYLLLSISIIITWCSCVLFCLFMFLCFSTFVSSFLHFVFLYSKPYLPLKNPLKNR